MTVQFGNWTSNDWFSLGEQFRAVREPDGSWWTHCDACNWSAAAGSWDELFRLTSEFHRSPDAKHRAWMLYTTVDEVGSRP